MATFNIYLRQKGFRDKKKIQNIYPVAMEVSRSRVCYEIEKNVGRTFDTLDGYQNALINVIKF